MVQVRIEAGPAARSGSDGQDPFPVPVQGKAAADGSIGAVAAPVLTLRELDCGDADRGIHRDDCQSASPTFPSVVLIPVPESLKMGDAGTPLLDYASCTKCHWKRDGKEF